MSFGQQQTKGPTAILFAFMQAFIFINTLSNITKPADKTKFLALISALRRKDLPGAYKCISYFQNKLEIEEAAFLSASIAATQLTFSKLSPR